ncbi:MAG: hypothetical protein IKH58_14910 [Bacteroidales bacterium]|nr:hypothetical protein [Bacteroidales bacterium]
MFRPNVLSPLSTTTDYVNGYIFTNNNLSMARTDNGYYTLSSTGTPTYHFYLKDHQGNNRVVVTQTDSIVQINHYYPYGALFAESTNGDVQRFKYDGLISDVTNGNKELDRKFGLDWYDHGARHNDAAIGRWHSMDPMTEEHPQFSPYSYCFGDPVNLGDYNGMIPTFEEGAALANHVYEGMENEQVGDWTCISITVNKSNGLRYGIYSHKKDT